MKYIESGFDGDSSDVLNILLLNDLHLGAQSANLSLLDKCIWFALQNEKTTRVLLNGDYIEGVTKQSKGSVFEQTMSPKEQRNAVKEKLKPIAHLIDGATIGNHDFRIENETSIDIVEDIMEALDIQDRYINDHGIIGFHLGPHIYTVEMHHGTGGGSTIAAVENAMKKLWKSDSDVMYCGHWHKEFAKPIKKYRIDPDSQQAIAEKRWMVCGNTILDTAKYAKRGGFEESFPSQAMLMFNGAGPKMIDIAWIRA